VASSAGKPLLAGIKFMFPIEIVSLVIQCRPVITVTFTAIDKTFHFHRVRLGYAFGIRAGVQNSAQGQGNQYDV
jgi:hypothetical protein